MLNDQDSRIAAEAITHAADMIKESIQQTVSQYGTPAAIYKPNVWQSSQGFWIAQYRPVVDTSDSVFVTGRGDTPAEAISDFNEKWNGGWEKA